MPLPTWELFFSTLKQRHTDIKEKINNIAGKNSRYVVDDFLK